MAPEAAILLPELIDLIITIRPATSCCIIDSRSRNTYDLSVAVRCPPSLILLAVLCSCLIARLHDGQVLQIVKIVQISHMLLLLHHLLLLLCQYDLFRLTWVDTLGDQLVLALLELLGRPDLPSLRVGLVHISPLRLQLQVILARTLVYLERVESVALKVSLAIEVHILKGELLSAHATCPSHLFDTSDGCFLALVLLTLLLLQLVHHGHFFNRCAGGSHWCSFILLRGRCSSPWVRG